MTFKREYAVPLASFLILVALLLSTQPNTLPSIVLIVPFVLIFVFIWTISFMTFRKYAVSKLRSVRLSLVLAGLPVSLMLLQSIGQLTIRDVITILLFFSLAYFYISRLAAPADES
jgi:hypothetical protein